jgi:hypothetical protein
VTPAQKQALQHLHHRGGEGAIDRHGSVVAGGVRLQFLADTVPPGASVTFGEAVREDMRLAHEKREITTLLPYLGGRP